MKKLLPPALRNTAARILAAATLALAASCSKTPAPEPFTAQLDNVDGAMAFISLQHPKLLCQSVNNLTAAIPEAAYLNMFIGLYGARLGYPDFPDIAPGTSIGVYQPVQSLDALRRREKPAAILFIKLKENGKIWNALTKLADLHARKQGDWTMFARDDADFDSVKNPAAIIARLSAPQAENLRAWFSLNGETAAAYQTLANDAITAALAKSNLADAEKNAFAAYARALLDDLLASTHSAHATLDLANTGARLTCGLQFKPDTPAGTALRYRPDATPAIGQHIANDALYSAVFRFVPKALEDYNKHITDLLLKVDYPPLSKPLAKLAQDAPANYKQMDGCGALATNIILDLDFNNPRATKTTDETLTAYSGHFDAQSLARVRTTLDLVQKMLTRVLDIARETSALPMPEVSITNAPAAARIEDCDFDEVSINVAGAQNPLPPRQLYIGVAAGNLVTASTKTILQKRLPALLAKKPLPDNVAAANPLQPGDQFTLSLNGPALADMACQTIAKLAPADPDIQATIAEVKDAYKQTAPARLTLAARQADASLTVDIPYKFVAATMQLGRHIFYSVKTQ